MWSFRSDATPPALKAREDVGPTTTIGAAGVRRAPTDHIELYGVDRFLGEAEIAAFLSDVASAVEPSKMIRPKGGSADDRSSRTVFYDRDRLTAAASKVQAEVCRLLGASPMAAEQLQLQVYAPGGSYGPHLDSDRNLPPYTAPDGSVRDGARLWTFIIYLTDGAPGSGTFFPLLELEIAPARGSAFFWKNLYPSGRRNPYSVHQGLPVANDGAKAILTQWIRTPG